MAEEKKTEKKLVFKCSNCRKSGSLTELYEFTLDEAKKIPVGPDRYSIFCPACNNFLGIYEGGAFHSHKA